MIDPGLVAKPEFRLRRLDPSIQAGALIRRKSIVSPPPPNLDRTASLAHLLIHARTERTLAATSWLSTFLSRCLRRARSPASMATATLTLTVDDLKGQRVFEAVSPAPLLDLPLKPGTYHVKARRGKAVHQYTLTLAPSDRFELHLSPFSERA